MRHIALRVTAAVLSAVAMSFGVTLPAGAAEDSMVTVVHGIPGQPVDVYVNGKKTLDNFAPATVAGPLTLPAATYDIALTKPGEAVDKAILRNNALAVPGGQDVSLAAHLDASGKPALTAFVNDRSKLAAGQARLIVRHTAAAPAVDVRAGGKPVFSGLTNPKENKADLPAGTVNADVVLAGTTTVAIGPKDLVLKAGAATIVYAIGSAEAKSLTFAAQTIDGLGGAPSGMPAGGGGTAGSGLTPWGLALAGLVAAAVVVVARRRPAAEPR
ncbi:DUF4397 domain-containing protein [Lentzea sp. HUAS12]|uniref:DUF4397 domain-containing protein n=1 Tax=Lentzea sp. HUAS12 TaxID=2951806 RepID=UPI0020A1512F|nr:DUF4397 domain-containing protein [Lentzea sp. HUAS12]USX55537.1 DUF4397 domain-containing protein [Lentzea sp. HUAS12]